MTVSRPYRRLVWATFIAALLVVVWGGIVRVSGSGLGCPDWPLCHGQFLPSLDLATRIEWTHRLLALVSGLGAAALVGWSTLRYRSERVVFALVVLCGGLFLLPQAGIGGILDLPRPG